MKKILIVDDEVRIREVIKEYGNLYGYDVFQANDGYEALDLLEENQFDCIVLDIMMPNIDGYTTCKKIKEAYDVPIIMLSARTQEEDKLYGFELGIDDYIAKPFSPKELMARIKVVIERNSKKSDQEVHEYKNLRINETAHEVSIDGINIHLTNKEYDLLMYFLRNPNKVISRERLLDNVWGMENDSNDRTVDTHIKMLRKNLGVLGSDIVTVRGVGYKFEKQE